MSSWGWTGCPGSSVGCQAAVENLSLTYLWAREAPECRMGRMSGTLLAAQICCAAKVEQSSQPKVPPQHGVRKRCPRYPLPHTALWSSTSSQKHCQNYSHYRNVGIAADPPTVCQTKTKCLMFQAKILRISLLHINTKVASLGTEKWKESQHQKRKKSWQFFHFRGT